MSAFEYYAKKSITEDNVNRKRKNKKKLKKTPVKITKTESSVENSKKNRTHVLNNIYNFNLKDSSKTGQKLLEWLIHPNSIDDFMRLVCVRNFMYIICILYVYHNISMCNNNNNISSLLVLIFYDT